jgi:hypothetical protein
MAGKPNPPKEYAREPTGRPSKFTTERRASIIDAISHRIPYEMAAEANGISLETLYEWLRIGKDHRNERIESDYTIFSEALKRAEMTKVREHTEIIASRPERWQADAWLLERRWHKYFSANAQLNELNNKLDQLLDGDKNEKGIGQERNEQDDKEEC